jgi:hypothetical protein
LKEGIDSLFSTISERVLPEKKLKDIQNLLKKASPWSEAKKSGKAFLPAGDATVAFNRLNKKAKSYGLNIVEVGELESFVKTVGNHGPKWVNEVLKRDLKNDSELEEARKFVKRLVE